MSNPIDQPTQQEEEKSQMREYYTNITYFSCYSGMCKVNAFQSTGYHCLTCNEEELEENNWKPLYTYDITQNITDGPTTVNCEGLKCRLNNEVIYCESCNGERYNEESDYDRLLVNRLSR